MVTVASGGAPLVIAGTIVKEAMAVVATSQSAAAGFAAKAAVDVVGAVAVGETTFAAAVALEGAAATAAASTVATTNFWNPVGWSLGVVIVGACEAAPHNITWDCYKLIIHDAVEEPPKPMLLTALVSHPMVARVDVSIKATSAGLPDIGARLRIMRTGWRNEFLESACVQRGYQ
ncbi:hypothetical protein FOBRF1_001385 [Fusarium oxysporum]